MRVVCYHMYQVFKPTILNSHSLWLMESQSKSTAKPQSLRQAPVHCDSISKLPVITSRCKSTCVKQYEYRAVAPCKGLELFERRVARGAHFAFVAHLRLADIARVAVLQPPTHRPPPFGYGGGHTGAANGTAVHRRAVRHFRGTTTTPRRM